MSITQPIKIHGGKGAFRGKLAKWIISLMPPHTHYCEPFFGGGSVLLNKDPDGVSEVVNDLDGDLINFWRCLQDQRKFRELQRILSVTPLSEAEFRREDLGTAVEWAARFFVKCRQSRQGLRKDYVTPTKRTRRGMNEQVSAWLTAIDGLKDVRDRLIRVEILNESAVSVIEARDHIGCLFYCDPPYLHETRSSGGEYRVFEMTDEHHLQLLATLKAVKGSFLLSGYRSDMYDHFAEVNGWERFEFETPNNAASGPSKEARTECVWRKTVEASTEQLNSVGCLEATTSDTSTVRR